MWSYSYFALLVPVFLLTDLVRYKPMINFEGAAYVGTWCMLLWADGVLNMQLMEFLYGIATSTEVAYFTYIYAKVLANNYFRHNKMFLKMKMICGLYCLPLFNV